MTFQELLSQIVRMKCQEVRTQAANGLEVVLSTPQLAEVTPLLDSYFSGAIKPAGQQASSEAAEIAKRYGGIWDNQTMYFSKKENFSEVALIWPWNNGQSVTLKMLQH